MRLLIIPSSKIYDRLLAVGCANVLYSVLTLEHDLFTAPIVTLNHVQTIQSVRVQCCWSCLCRCGVSAVIIGRLGNAQSHTESPVTTGNIIHAACMLGRVVTYGCVLVRALGAREGQAVGPQEVIQVLIAVTGRQGSATITTVKRERKPPKTRVPTRVHCVHWSVGIFHNVKLRELLCCWPAIVVWISRIYCKKFVTNFIDYLVSLANWLTITYGAHAVRGHKYQFIAL